MNPLDDYIPEVTPHITVTGLLTKTKTPIRLTEFSVIVITLTKGSGSERKVGGKDRKKNKQRIARIRTMDIKNGGKFLNK